MDMRLNHEKKDLCLNLMHADSEEKVVKILTDYGVWENKKAWRYYGDRASNFNTIGNQQSRPDAALVEKLINSVDAKLINECLIRSIDPESNNAPKNMREAVALFYDNESKSSNAGLIREWTSSKRTKIAKGITLSATGKKPNQGNPCFIISDDGEGQSPAFLPYTILSLDKDNKIKIPFVQGKYNMGGTGVLEFCGNKNLQLVLSRRNPVLLPEDYKISDTYWGFTIVRREDPEGGRKSSVYTYLAPIDCETRPHKGDVLSFSSDEMPIFPENKNPFGRNSKWGTLIKLYEYSTSGFSSSNILLSDGLMRQLDLLLTDLALPIRIYECRAYTGHKGSFETNLTGISVRLDDDIGSNLEDAPYSASMQVSNEHMTAKIYVFKKNKADTYRSIEGIIFSLNGQTHGYLTKNFFKRKNVGMSYLADSILVSVDCSEITERSREILFMPSRERLRECTLKNSIEKALEEIIGNHSELKKLRERRRREEIESMLEEEKPLGEILEELIKDSPTLTSLFLQGSNIPNPFKLMGVTDDDEKKIPLKRFPTFFKIKDIDYGKVFRRDCYLNRRIRIFFETDAENNYFSRDTHRGIFSLYYLEENERHQVQHTLNLSNGIATLNMTLPASCKIDESIEITAITTDNTQFEPFKNIFELSIKDETTNLPGKPGKRRNPPSNKPGNLRELASGIELPKIIKVAHNPSENQKAWVDMTPPFDEYSAIRIVHYQTTESNDNLNSESKDVYDFFVNIDNIFLKTEQKRSNEDADVIAAKFIYALVLLALSILNNSKKMNLEYLRTDDENIENKIENFSISVAPVILPIINELGNLELEYS